MRCYRIVEMKDGEPHTLYHGINGTRKMEVGKWMVADNKWARDGQGQKKYMTGFHVFRNKEDAYGYLNSMFKIKKDRRIIECTAHFFRKKEQSKGNVYLADVLRIESIKEVKM